MHGPGSIQGPVRIVDTGQVGLQLAAEFFARNTGINRGDDSACGVVAFFRPAQQWVSETERQPRRPLRRRSQELGVVVPIAVLL
jgi:hypothetical protein